MPELYGQPRKDELRRRINELSTDLKRASRERRELQSTVDYLRAFKTELEIKIQRMEASAKEALSVAGMDVADRAFQRMENDRKAARAAEAEKIRAELNLD